MIDKTEAKEEQRKAAIKATPTSGPAARQEPGPSDGPFPASRGGLRPEIAAEDHSTDCSCNLTPWGRTGPAHSVAQHKRDVAAKMDEEAGKAAKETEVRDREQLAAAAEVYASLSGLTPAAWLFLVLRLTKAAHGDRRIGEAVVSELHRLGRD